MIAALQHGLLGSQWLLYLLIAVAGAGIGFGWIGKDPRAWLAGWIGKAALAVSIFLAGYQMADERAAHEAAMAELRGENARLSRDLGVQRMIAQMADQERTALAEAKAELQQINADYEAKLAAQPQNKDSENANPCALDAADVTHNRRLQHRPAR